MVPRLLTAVVAPEASGIDAGPVALALARQWADEGHAMLYAGLGRHALAARLRDLTGVAYDPAERGFSALLAHSAVSGRTSLDDLAESSYSIDTLGPQMWLLLRPSSAPGTQLAMAWLTSQMDLLARFGQERSIVIAVGAPHDEQDNAAELLARLPALLVVCRAAANSDITATGMMFEWLDEYRAARGHTGIQQRACIVFGPSAIGDEHVAGAVGCAVAGHLPDSDDDRLLRWALRLPTARSKMRRAERAFAQSLTDAAAGAAAYLDSRLFTGTLSPGAAAPPSLQERPSP